MISAVTATTTAPLIMGAELTAMAEAGYDQISGQMLQAEGTYMMGDSGSEYAERTVYPFRIGRRAVTNVEYKNFVETLGECRSFLAGPDLSGTQLIPFAMGTKTALEDWMATMSVEKVARMLGEKEAALFTHAVFEDFARHLCILEMEPHAPYSGFEHPDWPANVSWVSAALYAGLHCVRLPVTLELEYAFERGILQYHGHQEFLGRRVPLPTVEWTHGDPRELYFYRNPAIQPNSDERGVKKFLRDALVGGAHIRTVLAEISKSTLIATIHPAHRDRWLGFRLARDAWTAPPGVGLTRWLG